jgi:hypothetical protein
MFVQATKCKRGHTTYLTYLVRESFRTPQGPRSRTICNITALPPETRELIRQSLQGRSLVAAESATRSELSSSTRCPSASFSIACSKRKSRSPRLSFTVRSMKKCTRQRRLHAPTCHDALRTHLADGKWDATEWGSAICRPTEKQPHQAAIGFVQGVESREKANRGLAGAASAE